MVSTKANKRLNIREVLSTIEDQKLSVFSPRTFAKFFRVSLQRATVFLSSHARRGDFIRLSKGIYSPVGLRPSLLEVANLIRRPSYISLETALSYHHIIPETVYSITSITTEHSKNLNALNQIFRYHKLDRRLYFGYESIRIGNRSVIMATKEKALLDYLYFVARGQKKYNDRFDLRTIDNAKLSKYSKLFFKTVGNEFIKKKFALLLKRITP